MYTLQTKHKSLFANAKTIEIESIRYSIIYVSRTLTCKKNVELKLKVMSMEDRQRLLNDEKIGWRRESNGLHVYRRISKIREGRTKRSMTLTMDASKREECSNKIYHTEALFCDSSVLHASNDSKCIKED